MATRVLLLLPAAVPSANQTAGRVAQLLAAAATTARAGTWTSHETGAHQAQIIGPGGTPELTVVHVDYVSVLARQRSEAVKGRRGALRAWTALRLAVRALWRTRAAAAQKPSTPKASRQLWVAVGASLVLVAWALFLVGSVICAAAAVWAPDTWFEDSIAAQLTLTAGMLGVVVALLRSVRVAVLEAGERLRSVMTYFENPDERHRVVGVVESALDGVLERDPQAEIHVLAYSLGSIVALDALWPDRSYPGPRRGLDEVASLTTLGCPVEMVRMLYPAHFVDREVRRPDLASLWHNVQIPVDLLASDLKGHWPTTDPAANPSQDPELADARPEVDTAVGPGAAPSRRGVLRLDGFRVHANYWEADDPRYLRAELGRWLP